jgi:uncharacterized protein YabN with tetrapyrrole methylase and pyrophosphatase domain
MQAGSLIVVGTGIRALGQMTTEAIAWMRRADRVLYVVADPIAEEAIRQLNPAGAESLEGFYQEGQPRAATYAAMAERIMECVRLGQVTCAVFYGHPGIYVNPAHQALRQARAEGYSARMLPAISAEDCLFADLEVDPAVTGCQSYDATDLILHQRLLDPSAALVVWQIGIVGDWTYARHGYNLAALPQLIERLCAAYPEDHDVTVYQAAIYPGCDPIIQHVQLKDLASASLSSASTLYIPPAIAPKRNAPIPP